MIASSKKPDLSSLNHSGLYEVARQKQTKAASFPSGSERRTAAESLAILREEAGRKARRRKSDCWSIRGSGSRIVDILVVLGFLLAFTVAASFIMIALQ